jgi:hypothetical protein
VAADAASVIDGVVGISAASRRGQFVGGPYSGLGPLDVAGRLRIPVLLIAEGPTSSFGLARTVDCSQRSGRATSGWWSSPMAGEAGIWST